MNINFITEQELNNIKLINSNDFKTVLRHLKDNGYKLHVIYPYSGPRGPMLSLGPSPYIDIPSESTEKETINIVIKKYKEFVEHETRINSKIYTCKDIELIWDNI